jgi:antitoxin ParD1/3/4
MSNENTVTLTPAQREFVHSRMESGRYHTAEEVVSDGRRLLEEQERDRQAALAEVKAKIASGLAQARRGELLDGEQVFEELLADLEARSAS